MEEVLNIVRNRPNQHSGVRVVARWAEELYRKIVALYPLTENLCVDSAGYKLVGLISYLMIKYHPERIVPPVTSESMDRDLNLCKLLKDVYSMDVMYLVMLMAWCQVCDEEELYPLYSRCIELGYHQANFYMINHPDFSYRVSSQYTGYWTEMVFCDSIQDFKLKYEYILKYYKHYLPRKSYQDILEHKTLTGSVIYLNPFGQWKPTKKVHRWTSPQVNLEIYNVLLCCKRKSYPHDVAIFLCSYLCTKKRPLLGLDYDMTISEFLESKWK